MLAQQQVAVVAAVVERAQVAEHGAGAILGLQALELGGDSRAILVAVLSGGA